MGAMVYRWLSLERWHSRISTSPAAEEAVSPGPAPTAAPSRPPVVSGKLDTAKLFNGITLRTAVETPVGGAASDERVDPQSYVLDLKLQVRVPTPNRTLEELARVSPSLPKLLPALGSLINAEAVSPLFGQLYETKVRMLRENLGRLDLLLSRHNFYDCQTVLALKHPESHRKVLMFQADMDVDSDGSDGDRLPAGSGVSPNFKPFTSFRWDKRTKSLNPYLPPSEERLKKAEAENKNGERKREIAQLKDDIDAMKRFSYLIGATDPYMVVPGSFTRGTDPARVGDYALVIYGDQIYPTIVGDVGPNDKLGEASLRIAKEISGSATAMNRPVNDLKVTYAVFPGTADPKFGPPDLDKLQSRCEALVKEMGGASVPLHHWENIIPTPTPTPSPTPVPSPTPSASPVQTPALPSPSPAATFAFPIQAPTPTPP